jgi:hypothetical protein
MGTKILASLFGFFVAFSVLFPVVSVSAQFNPLGTACNSSDEAKNSPACVESRTGQKQATDGKAGTNPISGRNGIITRAVNIIAFATGVIAVIIIIISGFSLVTAGGDSGKVKTARDTIIYAAVGLVIIAVSRSVVILIINATNN